MPRQSVRNVTKIYGKDFVAVDNISLNARWIAGDAAGAVGMRQDHHIAHDCRSGNCEPGQILIGDVDITQLPATERDVSMVFQSYALFPQDGPRERVIRADFLGIFEAGCGGEGA